MSAKKPKAAASGGADERVRMQIFASKKQHDYLYAAAEAAGCDVHCYVMGHVMKAVVDDSSRGAPVVLDREVSDRVRLVADAQGVSPSALIAQLLVASEIG